MHVFLFQHAFGCDLRIPQGLLFCQREAFDGTENFVSAQEIRAGSM